MKKYLKILTPLLVVVTVLIIGTSIAFADEEVPVKAINTDSVSKPTFGDPLQVAYGSVDGKKVFATYAVTAPATGKMYIDVKAAETNQYGITSAIGTVSDGDSFSYYDNRTSYTSPGATDLGIGCFDVVKGKTYYVGLNSTLETTATVQVKAYIIPYANNRTLKASSTFTIASAIKGIDNKETALYYKIKPTKTGVITVTLKNYGSSDSYGYITLYNSSKKVRSEKLRYSSTSSSYKVRFGVKKGVTYYLKATGIYGYSKENYKYGIKYSIKAATDRSLSKKSNAKTLKRGATATATLFTANGSTETDWYKFKVTKARETVLKIDLTEMRGSDQKITITSYKGSKKIGSSTLYPGNSYDYTIKDILTGKASTGTYYIKLTKTKKLSGKYKIKYAQ